MTEVIALINLCFNESCVQISLDSGVSHACLEIKVLK